MVPSVAQEYVENRQSLGHQGSRPQVVALCQSYLGLQGLEALAILGRALLT